MLGQKLKRNGLNIDGNGNIIDKGDKNKNELETEDDVNKLMLKGSVDEKAKKKEFTSINSYKPTGIYSDNLLNKLNDKLNNK